MALARYGWIALALLAAGLGILALVVAREHPVSSFGGTSTLGGIAELGRWVVARRGRSPLSRAPPDQSVRHPALRGRPRMVPAGVEQPQSRCTRSVSPWASSVSSPVLRSWLTRRLAYPTGKLRSRLEVAVVAFSYAGAILLLGLLPAAVFDPKATGCFQCPPNLVLVRGDDGLFDTFNRYGLRAGVGWLAALGVLLLWRLVRSSHAAAAVFPVLVPAIAYLALVAWDFQHAWHTGSSVTNLRPAPLALRGGRARCLRARRRLDTAQGTAGASVRRTLRRRTGSNAQARGGAGCPRGGARRS